MLNFSYTSFIILVKVAYGKSGPDGDSRHTYAYLGHVVYRQGAPSCLSDPGSRGKVS